MPSRTRSVQRRAAVHGDPAVLGHLLAGDPHRWLPRPARPAGEQRWRTILHAGP